MTHYVHDIFGNIIAETAGGGATGATGTVREYVWLYETEIAPTSGSRTTVDRPLAVVDAVNTASPATWWISVDHLNRPVKMTNSAKAAVWTAVWQALWLARLRRDGRGAVDHEIGGAQRTLSGPPHL